MIFFSQIDTHFFSNVHREKERAFFGNDGVSHSTIVNWSSWSFEERRLAQQVAHGSSREARSSKSVRRFSQPSPSCLDLGDSALPPRRRPCRHRHRHRLPPSSSSSFLLRAPPQPGHRPLGRPRRPPADHLLVPSRRIGQEEARRGGEGQGGRRGEGAGEAGEAAEAAGRGVRDRGSLVGENGKRWLTVSLSLSRERALRVRDGIVLIGSRKHEIVSVKRKTNSSQKQKKNTFTFFSSVSFCCCPDSSLLLLKKSFFLQKRK